MFEITTEMFNLGNVSKEIKKTYDDLLKNRDILNYVLQHYKNTGDYPKTSLVKTHFGKTRLPAFPLLCNERLLNEDYSKQPSRLSLTFAGFLFCDSPEAKEYLGTMYDFYHLFEKGYNERRESFEFPFEKYCQFFDASTFEIIKNDLERVLFLFDQEPYSIFTLNWSVNSPHGGEKKVCVHDKIYEFNNADAFFNACFDMSRVKEKKTEMPVFERGEKRCGLLNKSFCDQVGFIKSEFNDKKIFLDIPYHDYLTQEKILRNVVATSGLEAVVAKDRISSSDKLCKICRLLQTCKYGVADISYNRQSVSYELGLLHAFSLPTCILLNENTTKFGDMDGLEHQSYTGTNSLRITLGRWLLQNVSLVNRSELQKLIKANIKFLSRERKFIDIKSPDTIQRPKTKLQAFKKFLDQQIQKIDAFSKKQKIEPDDISSWHHEFLKMIEEALGKEIKDRDVKLNLDIIENKVSGINFYPNSIDTKKTVEVLENIKHFISRIKQLVTSADLAGHFEPANLE